MTEFWYKLVDMTKSDAAIVSLGGVSISEKQLLWTVGVVLLIISILLLRGAIRWIFVPAVTPTAKEDKTTKLPETITAAKTDSASTTQTSDKPVPSASVANDSPQSLLTDTSEKKRSMQDYVTPDSIAADVAKKPLTNDYPYQTLKPDPTKISAVSNTTAPNTAQTTQPLPAVTVPAIIPQQPVVVPTQLNVEPTPTQPTTTALSPQSIDQPLDSSPVDSIQPEVVVPTAPDEPPKMTPPVAQTPSPQFSAALQDSASTLSHQPSTILPPLPTKEPTSHMVVGIADDTAQPIKKSTFNPVDPVIP